MSLTWIRKKSLTLFFVMGVILSNISIYGRAKLLGSQSWPPIRLLMLSGGSDEGVSRAINIKQKLQQIEDTDLWSPKVISTVNDYQIKVVKVMGDFTWHDHKDTDEVFIVLEGELVIDIEGQASVVLKEGEMFVVPKGIVHKPYAAKLCKVLLIEPRESLTPEMQWTPP